MKNKGNIFGTLLTFGILVLLGFISFGCAQSHPHTKPADSHAVIEVKNGWVRAMPPVAKNSAAYMKFSNNNASEDQLISVSSSISEKAEIHEIVSIGDMLSMRKVELILIPAKGSVDLKPGGYHIMLLGLKSPIKVGDLVQIHLTFEKAGKVSVSLPAQESAAMVHGNHNMDHSNSHKNDVHSPDHDMDNKHKEKSEYPIKPMDHKM